MNKQDAAKILGLNGELTPKIIKTAFRKFTDKKDHNSLSVSCGFFDLSVNEVIQSTGRTRKTLENWSKNDRTMLLIVLIGCNKLSQE